jgi:dihydropteroate synthase
MLVFGILNCTPNSFSDGGKFVDLESSVKHAQYLHKNGVHVIDIGAESTAPGNTAISSDVELSRLKDILPNITKICNVSIDSRNFQTQKFAVDNGARYVNDVSGFSDESILSYAKNLDVNFVFMHNCGVPIINNMPETGNAMLSAISFWCNEKLKMFDGYNIGRDRLFFDPGIGFGKDANQSIYILQNIDSFKNLGVKIMIGHSRKSFLRTLFQAEKPTILELDLMTSVITTSIMHKGIDAVRVHNPHMVINI